MTTRFPAWLAACLVAGAILRAGPLTVATYNLENYTVADRVIPDGYRQDYPKPEAEKAALRAVIRQIGADVLAVQEIGGEPFLAELQRDLRSDGVDYPHTALIEAEDKERMVAVLSRRPLVRVVRHDDLVFKYADGPAKVRRGLLEVRVNADSGEIALFVVHLKSRHTERPDDPQAAAFRAGEATTIRDRVLGVFPDPAAARFVIAGDFNDTRGSRPLRAMLERGKTTIAEWVPAADDRGEVWSHFYRKDDSYSRIDHVLVSPGLRPRIRGGAAVIWATAETRLASDHRPLVFTIE